MKKTKLLWGLAVDHKGRPGINTVLSPDDATKDMHNVTIPSNMEASFQAAFEAQLNGLHAAFGTTYENNILGLDAATLTTVLANDALDVAPDAPTTYFNPGAGGLVPDGDEVVLTGRALTDDVIDVSLILLFGGSTGDRFSGQDDGMGGTLPCLTSDGASFTANPISDFPYLGTPE